MVRHRSSFLKGAALLQVSSDPGCPEAVIPELGCDTGRGCAPANNRVSVCLWQHGASELAGTAASRAEQWPLGIAAQSGAVEIGSQVLLEVVVARYAWRLPPFPRNRTQSARFWV
jgi:hypothetical protein